MWKFITRHPFLCGALLFFFLVAVGLGVGLTLTGIFAPFGFGFLGLAGAGLLLFGITFIPPALVLAIPLRSAWVSDQIGERAKEATVAKQQGKIPNQQQDSPTETADLGSQENDQIASTSSSSSTPSTASSSSASTGVTEEEARLLADEIMIEVIKRKVPGYTYFQPVEADDKCSLIPVKVDGSGYKLVLEPEIEADNKFSNTIDEDTLDYDISKEFGEAGMSYCPQGIKNLVHSINSIFQTEDLAAKTATVVVTTKQLDNNFYTYAYSVEISPTQVKRILDALPPPKPQPVSTAAPTPTSSSSSTSSVSTGGGATTVAPSGAGVGTGFSSSPLAPPPKGSTTVTTPPVPLTEQQLEEVKAEVLKVGTNNEAVLKTWLGDNPETKFKVFSSGEMSLRIVSDVIYTFDNEPSFLGVKAKFETMDEGKNRTLPWQMKFIANLNRKYEDAAEKSTVMEDPDYDAHNYSYGFKISADKVRAIWESLKLEKEAAAAQPSTPSSSTQTPST